MWITVKKEAGGLGENHRPVPTPGGESVGVARSLANPALSVKYYLHFSYN